MHPWTAITSQNSTPTNQCLWCYFRCIIDRGYFIDRHQGTVSISRAKAIDIFNRAVVLVITALFEIGFTIWPYALLKAQGMLSVKSLVAAVIIRLKNSCLSFLPFWIIRYCCLGVLRHAHSKNKPLMKREIPMKPAVDLAAPHLQRQKILCNSMRINAIMAFLLVLMTSGKTLYLPLCNKLTISPPGGGKTTASSIPLLLSHKGPVFVFDIRGELWAVTARYRAETLGRQVIVIDPFGVTKGKDFQAR